MKVLALVGRSGVGKTALLELALRQLTDSGRRVLAVKSSHHDLADTEGTDSSRFSQAGADAVVLHGKKGLHLFAHPWSLEQLLPLLAPSYEIALVEGGKQSAFPKVELLGREPPLLSSEHVVGRLTRGKTVDDLEPVLQFLQLLESHGGLV